MENRKYLVNDKFFNEIYNWTEKQAYVLGWILSDGHISKNGNKIEIKLQKSDKKILEEIKNIIKFTGQIKIEKRNGTNLKSKNYQDRAVLRFCSKEIKTTLNSIGYDNNKGRSMKFPSFISKNIVNHFLRGYFDGDGCISFSKNRKRILGESNLVCSNLFFEKINNILNSNLKIKTRTGANFNNGCKTLRMSGNLNMLKLFIFLYKDSKIIFKRKFRKFLRIINFTKKRPSLIKTGSNIIQEAIKVALNCKAEAKFI